jgi:leucine dehydrogenase
VHKTKFDESDFMAKRSMQDAPAPLLEQFITIDDPSTGVKGAIAIHSRALGPAAGGCRVWHYPSHAALAADAIRLAEGMSYKNALAELPFGGGKAVLQAPSRSSDRAKMLSVFARHVEALRGQYVTAEDVGTTVADMSAVRQQTRYVAGLEAAPGRAGGDPSPWTALGIFLSIRAAVQTVLSDDIEGLTVAIQGVGNVGGCLARLLNAAGAKLIIADVNLEKAKLLASELNAEVASVDSIVSSQCDIFAPCALGGVLTEKAVDELKAQFVIGGANNQLSSHAQSDQLQSRGIVYAPDYLVNAGGIINVAAEYLGETSADVERRVRKIPTRLIEILKESQTEGVSASIVADRRARAIIAAATGKCGTAMS